MWHLLVIAAAGPDGGPVGEPEVFTGAGVADPVPGLRALDEPERRGTDGVGGVGSDPPAVAVDGGGVIVVASGADVPVPSPPAPLGSLLVMRITRPAGVITAASSPVLWLTISVESFAVA